VPPKTTAAMASNSSDCAAVGCAMHNLERDLSNPSYRVRGALTRSRPRRRPRPRGATRVGVGISDWRLRDRHKPHPFRPPFQGALALALPRPKDLGYSF
jgi:hypothetical protein